MCAPASAAATTTGNRALSQRWQLQGLLRGISGLHRASSTKKTDATRMSRKTEVGDGDGDGDGGEDGDASGAGVCRGRWA